MSVHLVDRPKLEAAICFANDPERCKVSVSEVFAMATRPTISKLRCSIDSTRLGLNRS